jgi:hypothetical protein
MRDTREKKVKTGTIRYQVITKDDNTVYGEYASKAYADTVCAFLNMGVREYVVVKI